MFSSLLWPIVEDLIGFFFLIGALPYFIDRTLGAGFYRWRYNLTHEHPLPAGAERGYVFYQRKMRRQFAFTAVVSILLSAYRIHSGENPLILLLMWFDVPVSLLGARLMGPVLYRMWAKREAAFAYGDAVSEGKADPIKDAKEAAGRVVQQVAQPLKSSLGETLATVRETVAGEAESAKPAAAPAASAPAFDPKQAFERFIGR